MQRKVGKFGEEIWVVFSAGFLADPATLNKLGQSGLEGLLIRGIDKATYGLRPNHHQDPLPWVRIADTSENAADQLLLELGPLPSISECLAGPPWRRKSNPKSPQSKPESDEEG